MVLEVLGVAPRMAVVLGLWFAVSNAARCFSPGGCENHVLRGRARDRQAVTRKGLEGLVLPGRAIEDRPGWVPVLL